MDRIEKNQVAYVHCAGGYRSVIFLSILRARGYRRLINVAGGFKAIRCQNRIPIINRQD